MLMPSCKTPGLLLCALTLAPGPTKRATTVPRVEEAAQLRRPYVCPESLACRVLVRE